MVKFLIIRFSSIGDIVLTTPIIRALKQQVQDAEIHYLTKKQYSGIITTNPNVDKVHIFEGDYNAMLENLKYEHFDHIIDLHNSLRSRRVCNSLPVTSLRFRKLNWEKWLLVNLKINKLPKIHIVDRYMETISYFDAINDNQGLDFFIPKNDTVEIETLPVDFHNGFVAFVIGGQHFTKRMPIEKIISICKKINKPIIILGGKEDLEVGEIICSEVGLRTLNTCGKYSLNQSASIVQQSTIVITHDTGLMHISSAFKKKIISVWGNTVPEFGMYPYLADKDSVIVENKAIKCRPCSKIGFSKCPKKHFKCMNEIDENVIISTVEKAFSK